MKNTKKLKKTKAQKIQSEDELEIMKTIEDLKQFLKTGKLPPDV